MHTHVHCLHKEHTNFIVQLPTLNDSAIYPDELYEIYWGWRRDGYFPKDGSIVEWIESPCVCFINASNSR